MSYRGRSLYLDFNSLPRPDKRFTIGRILASGGTTSVYEGVDHENENQKVAIKVLTDLADNVEAIEEEYRIFKDLSRKHDNFPTFYGAFLNKFDKEDKDEIWLVMEYCEGGSLGDLLTNLTRNHRSLPETLIAYIVREILNALTYLHMNHIVHRDIKARNVLLTKDGQVKLTDFGYSRHLKHTMSRRRTSLGSPHWMAPEVISSSAENFQSARQVDPEAATAEESDLAGYDNHCDIWSLGITAIELADGEPPLWNLHPVRALFQIVHNPPPELKKPLDWSFNFRDFLSECLVKNPDHRPMAMELAEHPFIQEIPEDSSMLRNQLITLINKTPTTIDIELPPEFVIREGKIKYDPATSYKRMYPDDLAALDNVDEKKVLLTLGNRFSRGQFQTYAGDVLVIINPQQDMRVYDKEHHERYMLKALPDEEPHIYAVVDKAWQAMLHHNEHQNIILSGDRNSGKSFNFNEVIKHMCYMAKGNDATARRIQQLPLILDCFGNAATEGNANSSRHARYVELTFTDSGKLSGAIVFVYLLEKWRICNTLSKSNRNYHVFYYIYYGLKNDGTLQKYFLDGWPGGFRFLPVGETEAEVEYYLKGYQKLKEYLRFWDMEEKEQEFIFNSIASILLLGQIEFQGDRNCCVANPEVLKRVATLLSVNASQLGKALCNSSSIVNGEDVLVANTVEEAEDVRDSLARGLYSRLVDWLVNQLNINMCLSRKVFGDRHTIGVLDPPGFDTMPRKNSFEQLLFNIINEQLTYHYNESVFTWEMDECKNEGISMEKFKFHDNRGTINSMLSKRDGLLALIDELARLPNGDDSLTALIQRSIQPNYVTIEGTEDFVVNHYGGEVKYRTQEIKKKNRDYLPANMIEVMRSSTNSRLSSVFTNKMTKTGHVVADASADVPISTKRESSSRGNKGFHTTSQGHYSQTRQMQTQAAKTRQSLVQLLQKMVRGNAHFVRCFRRTATGGTMSPGINKKCLADQIKNYSLVDTIRIRQHGYCYRVVFAEFLRRYQFLAFDFEETVELTGDNCRLLLVRLKMEGWKEGKTKIFLKYDSQEYLSRLYESQVRKIIKVQAVLRAVMAKLRKKRGGSKLSRRNSKDMTQEEAAVAIQSGYRGYSVRKEYGKVEPYNKNKRKFKRFQCESIQEEAAHTIQYFWRKWKGKSIFQTLLLYRADKQQQLVYFCQQAHVFNQEWNGYMRKVGASVDTSKITPETRQPIPPPKPKFSSIANKLPLLMKSRHFVDTTFMCIGEGGFDRNKLRQIQMMQEKKEQRFNKPKDHRHSANESLVKPSAIVKNKAHQFIPIPKSPPSRRPPPKSPPGRIAPPGGAPARTPPALPGNKPTINIISGSQTSLDQISSGGSKTQVKISDWNGRTANQQPSYGLSRPVGPMAPPRQFGNAGPANHRLIAKEMEQKVAEFSNNQNEDAADSAPFNFQAMLKKTNHARDSMKRNKAENGDVRLPPELTNNDKGNLSVVYQSHPKVMTAKPSNLVSGKKRESVKKYPAPLPSNKHEIAPGLVIEGEQADL